MNELINYIDNTEDAIYNFNLAQWYENLGYTAAGLTFYLRSAERSNDEILTYCSLLKGFDCYDKQGSRDDSSKVLLQHAVSVLPQRPEAYFLLAKFFDSKNQWQESYIYACIGLECADFKCDPLPINIYYPGKYGLLFYKAVAGYRWGKGDESRKLLQELLDNYDLVEPYKSSVVQSIEALGSNLKENQDKLPINLPVVENISVNFYHNQESSCTAIIMDNFYDKPDDVRNFALNQEFIDGGFGRGFIGKRSANQYLFDGLKQRFEDILGQKIKNWQTQPMNGRFQITYAGQPLVYHCDSQKWAGMIFLTPEPPFECGTTLYAHKKTRARSYHEPGWDYSWKDTHLGDLHLDGTFFEPVDVLGNVYNRLVIFDGSNIHSASKYFGQIDSNARLWHMFFFD